MCVYVYVCVSFFSHKQFHSLLFLLTLTRARAERLASRQELDEKDIELSRQASAQDFVDASKRELEQTPIGSTVTLADKNNDTKSLDRQLDRRLLLLVKQKVVSRFTWRLPFTKFDPEKDGKYLIKTAKRAVKEVIGDTVQCRFMGNTPSAVYTFKFRKNNNNSNNSNNNESSTSSDRETGITFIFKAHLISGNVSISDLNSELVKDFGWFTRAEVEKLWTEIEGEKRRRFMHKLKETFFQEHLDQNVVNNLIAKYTNRRSTQQRSSSSSLG